LSVYFQKSRGRRALESKRERDQSWRKNPKQTRKH